MNRNFHAIGAITFALPFPLNSVATALRLGWLPLLLVIVATVVFEQAGVSWSYGGVQTSAEIDLSGNASASAGRGFEISPEEFTLPVIGGIGLMIAAYVLAMPMFTNMIRTINGQQPEAGYLPTFGPHEVAYLIANLILLGAVVGFALAIGAVFTPIFLAGDDAPSALVLAAALITLVLLFGFIWFVVRAMAFAPHAAVTGRASFGEAFRMTKGRFWKLFGTVILFSVVLVLIDMAIGLVQLAAGSIMSIVVAVAIALVWQLYQMIANVALTAAIYRDLTIDQSA